ncbi:MAG: protoporphyrinogen oxidase HemJ [Flavobacteriales bacterium]
MYLYIKALHIIFIVTWFAGLFYIVRLFIYHAEASEKSEEAQKHLIPQYQLMSKRLWTIITWPSLILTLILGSSLLFLEPAWLNMPWMKLKLFAVLLLVIYHFYCHHIYKKLQQNEVLWTGQFLRIFNEVATLLLFAIVFLVVLKSFLSMWLGLSGFIGLAILLMLGIKLYKSIRNKND